MESASNRKEEVRQTVVITVHTEKRHLPATFDVHLNSPHQKMEVALEEATKSGAKSLIEFSDASRSSKGNFCPSGTTFSTFGFASFLLITLQTVINIVTGKFIR